MGRPVVTSRYKFNFGSDGEEPLRKVPKFYLDGFDSRSYHLSLLYMWEEIGTPHIQRVIPDATPMEYLGITNLQEVYFMYIPDGVNVINLTPHAINLVWEPVDQDGKGAGFYEPLHTFPASGQIARVTSKTVEMGEFYGIPLTTTEYSEVVGLPAPQPYTIYIVSSLVAQRVPERTDVFIPNESVRDSEGRITGCKSLGHI